jgi:hypothetical protein
VGRENAHSRSGSGVRRDDPHGKIVAHAKGATMTNELKPDRPACRKFAIAAISLVVAFYQSYLNTKVVDRLERDAARRAISRHARRSSRTTFR